MFKSQILSLLALGALSLAYHADPEPIYAARSSAPQTGEQADKPAAAHPSPGAESYASHCAICHGDQREGILPAFPPLLGVGRRRTDQQITDLVHQGKGRMPAFPRLEGQELAQLLHFLSTSDIAPSEPSSSVSSATPGAHATGLTTAGGALFQQNCAFCHGRDAAGGETGPDLTRSKLVLADVSGDKISEVVREGRPEKKMPAFNFSSAELLSLSTYIHAQVTQALAHKGSRRGVDVADLQTGNVEAGKVYFNGAGTCAKCHSPGGDLAGIATRYEGLQLEQRMLYPKDVKGKVTVSLRSGEKINGALAYLDEFTVALRDADGTYHSWPTAIVQYTVDSPVNAHVELFGKYSDDDIHNLMAYLQTLR